MNDVPEESPLFANSAENISDGKMVNKRQLVNILNFANFQDKTVLINFKHTKYNTPISIPAKPQPCMGDILECIWIESERLYGKFKTFKFTDIYIPHCGKLIIVKPEVKNIDDQKISFILPEICHEFNARKTIRHPCKNIRVELIQNGVIFHGALIDFSAESFRVEITAIPPQTFQWINPDNSVYIIFKNEHDSIFAGECIITQTAGQKMKIFTLAPLKNNIPRFKPKETRNIRHKLLPTPYVVFKHPVTNKIVNLEVDDISGSGFSVQEPYENSVLIPGMIIPDLEIEFAAYFKFNCRVQVIYRRIVNADNEFFTKCGIAFLDMDIRDQTSLSSILHRASDKKAHICSNKIDLDELWKFFFETGFVYPKKYAHMYANKEAFKKTYERLYHYNPNIARHFVYLEKGMIHGHMSTIRFYENTWLIHHHASSRSGRGRAGVMVLDQIGRYVNEFHSLHSTFMNFVMCYFRPDNKFPNRVFGGFARDLNNPKGCSLDTFVYFHLPRIFEQKDLSESWKLVKTQPEDLLELEGFYEYTSGGLMLYAMDLKPDMIQSNELTKEYQKLGFKRERHLFSLKRDGALKAVVAVTVSDIGLNLSNLTNCIHVIVLDSDDLPLNILYSHLLRLSHYYGQDVIPVLLCPVSYAETQFVAYEKIYTLWVLNMQSLDHYLKYIEKLFRRHRYE